MSEEQNNVTGNNIAINTSEGTATVNPEMLRDYVSEAFGYLSEISSQQADFKELVATISETTKLKKGVVSKYLKARFKEKTKADKDVGKVFEALDEALET